MQINRSLKNKDMDRIDHALGRPLMPTGETFRNFYATSGAEADEMAASTFWMEGKPGRDMRYFAVTDEGCQALADHLLKINDPHRAFAVTFDGHTRTVIAPSGSKARYSHFLDISDVMPDLTFIDYCTRASVRASR